MTWRYPNLTSGFAAQWYDPIYDDGNVRIVIVRARLVGDFNFIGLMSSFYEYCDMRVYLNLIFGGMERPIYPKYINSFIILPSEIYNYEYKNDVTGENYKINIDKAKTQLVKTTNRNEVVYPFNLLPRYKLTNISDGSTRYGGTDNVADWKLTWTVNYEVEIPAWLVLETDLGTLYPTNGSTNAGIKIPNATIGYGSCYSSNEVFSKVEVPSEIINVNVEDPSKKNISFKTRYYHIVTQQEVDSTSNVEIIIPETVNDKNLFKLVGKYGELIYGDHYTIDSIGTILTIIKENVELKNEDILELFIYGYS